MTCGLVTTKTMSKFSGEMENQYVKRWTVMRTTYGCVFAGYDSERNIAVAVKTCKRRKMLEKESLPEDPIKEKKYHLELCNLEMKRRPVGILAYVDHIETDDSIDIILEWANGGELWQHVIDFFRKTPILSKRKSEVERWKRHMQRIFKEICLGLKYLHDSGFVHRDLSLENVLLTRELPRKPSFLDVLGKPKETQLASLFDRCKKGERSLGKRLLELCSGEEEKEKDERQGRKNLENYIKWRNREKVYRAKICDFGVMERLPSNGRFTTRVGKQRYYSPECLKGNYDGKKNDVHCLGIMLLIMLLGSPLIRKVNDANYKYLIHSDKYRRHLVHSLVPESRKLKLVSEDAWDVLEHIFKEENSRASVDELLAMKYCSKISI